MQKLSMHIAGTVTGRVYSAVQDAAKPVIVIDATRDCHGEYIAALHRALTSLGEHSAIFHGVVVVRDPAQLKHIMEMDYSEIEARTLGIAAEEFKTVLENLETRLKGSAESFDNLIRTLEQYKPEEIPAKQKPVPFWANDWRNTRRNRKK